MLIDEGFEDGGELVLLAAGKLRSSFEQATKGGLGSDIRVGTHYEDNKKRYGAMRALSRTNDKELRPKSLY